MIGKAKVVDIDISGIANVNNMSDAEINEYLKLDEKKNPKKYKDMKKNAKRYTLNVIESLDGTIKVKSGDLTGTLFGTPKVDTPKVGTSNLQKGVPKSGTILEDPMDLTLNKIDKINKFLVNNDPNLEIILEILKYYDSFEYLPTETRIVFNYEIGKWYLKHGWCESAIERFKFVVSFILESHGKDTEKLYYSYRSLCICYYNLDDKKNHEVCYSLIHWIIFEKNHYKGKTYMSDVLTKWVIDWIWSDEKYKKWVKDNDFESVKCLNYYETIPSELKDELKDFDSVMKHIKNFDTLGNVLSTAIGYMKGNNANIKEALNLFNDLLSEDFSIPSDSVETNSLTNKAKYCFIYSRILICMCYLKYSKNLIQVYRKFISYHKILSKLDPPKDPSMVLMASNWTERIPKEYRKECRQFMIDHCPDFTRMECSPEELSSNDSKTDPESVKLSTEEVEKKNKEIELLREELKKKEELRNQPTVIIDKKEYNGSTKKQKFAKKKNKKEKVKHQNVESHRSRYARASESQRASESKRNIESKKDNLTPMIPVSTESHIPTKVKPIKKEKNLVSLIPVVVPVPFIPIGKGKKESKAKKKVSLDEWLIKK